MIDLFDTLYYKLNGNNPFLKKIRYYSFLRLIVRSFANGSLPIYFKLTRNFTKYSLDKNTNLTGLYIVSLTTIPERINRLWIVIETLLRQKEKPDKIILWLSKMQFPSILHVPENLKKLQKRGLEIQFCNDDLKSHKKYFYAFSSYPNNTIITVDDDVIYNSSLILSLKKLSKEFPNAICCNHAAYIGVKDSQIQPYKNWKTVIEQLDPSFSILPIGVGGVLYPPNSLYEDVLNKDLFINICLYADDIWLNTMSQLNGTKVAKSNYHSDFLPIIFWKNKTLHSKNIKGGENDNQLQAIRNHYITQKSIDPFINVLR